MAAYLVKIDEFLRTPGPIDNTCSLIEEKTKIQRKYIGVGVGIITMGLIFSTFAPLVVNLIAFVYPAYKSIKVNNLFMYLLFSSLNLAYSQLITIEDHQTRFPQFWISFLI